MTIDHHGSVTQPRREPAFIRLDPGHHDWLRAAVLLGAVGARRLLRTAGTVYGFDAPHARDRALDLVRKAFGWGVAIGFDGHSRLLVEGTEPMARSLANTAGSREATRLEPLAS